MHSYLKYSCVAVASCVLATQAWAQQNPKPVDSQPVTSTHIIGAAKLIIGDVKQNQAYYEQFFGMKEVSHYSAKDVYDEPIMGFSEGARLALFHPLAEPLAKKSQFPVALIYTPDFETLVKKMEDAKQPVTRLPVAQSGTFKIAIARDPSGNAIEIFSRPTGILEVGGSKLIVDDRQKAEDFYARIFGAKPGQRYNTPTYDEVLMQFGAGPFLALFQPKAEAPLPKSQFPVVAIYTSEFDAVLKRVVEMGLGYRDVKSSSPDTRIIIAKDPAGNSVEIIRRQAPAAK
jgi:catechol 2,3-dioxygenase-like lactoylglutathione lyase family enzyme